VDVPVGVTTGAGVGVVADGVRAEARAESSYSVMRKTRTEVRVFLSVNRK
jgi:hypothetical protein